MAEGRRVLLLVDNTPCHFLPENSPELGGIRLAFFPANTTPLIQPLDSAIIRSFKAHYHQLLMQSQLTFLGTGRTREDFEKEIDLWRAIMMISSAWQRVTEAIIRNCFRKAWSCDHNQLMPLPHPEQAEQAPEGIAEEIEVLNTDIPHEEDETPCFGA